jgi:hypothetical protein
MKFNPGINGWPHLSAEPKLDYGNSLSSKEREKLFPRFGDLNPRNLRLRWHLLA